MVGRSLVVTSPTRIKRVSVADPAIADAIVVSPNQVLVNGKMPGGVSLMLWDESDQSQAFEVSVDIDILSLSEKIHEVFPNEQVQIETSKDSVILSGHASSTAVADKILEVVKNATPKVTSLIVTPAVQPGEILLEVKFAEVDRSAVSQFGREYPESAGREEHWLDHHPGVRAAVSDGHAEPRAASRRPRLVPLRQRRLLPAGFPSATCSIFFSTGRI